MGSVTEAEKCPMRLSNGAKLVCSPERWLLKSPAEKMLRRFYADLSMSECHGRWNKRNRESHPGANHR
uniref:Uncharacterized protein n=1 Tax=Syphacia muris TaxID=451379 RepID=A0A0N5ABH6_9BILA